MTEDDTPNPALLPAGLRDVLPPDAETEAHAVEAVMGVFARHGYERVKPPLMEFEDSLIQGAGGAVADQTFRLMDPVSQRMMGLRADTTPQIARIAATRLATAPRPLRLSYAGQCLRVRGNQLAPDRQIAQAGIELIGADTPEADAEVVAVATEALAAVGLARISVDLTMPTLAPALIAHAIPDAEVRGKLARALDRKDAAAVTRHGGPLAATLTTLLLAAGPAKGALDALRAADLPEETRQIAERLADTVHAVRLRAPALRLTVATAPALLAAPKAIAIVDARMLANIDISQADRILACNPGVIWLIAVQDMASAKATARALYQWAVVASSEGIIGMGNAQWLARATEAVEAQAMPRGEDFDAANEDDEDDEF